MTPPNPQQIKEWLRNTLAAGGPVGLLMIKKLGISAGEYDLYLSAFLMLAPGAISLAWAAWDNRKAKQIQNVQAMPEVAKVVIPDRVNGTIGDMARSNDPNLAKVVTSTQNAKDKAA